MNSEPHKDPLQSTHEPGEDNLRLFGFELHFPVFFISAFLMVLFVFGAMMFPEIAQDRLDESRDWSIRNFDWLFMSAANIFVLFCLALIFLPVGRIRLGGSDAVPAFSRLSWFAMLFAAGMGIGLMFWSVAEPVAYFTDWFGTPLGVEAGTAEARRMALGATLYHWGLHPWAIYGLVALALAFFSYNKGMPLTIRSAFYPVLGERVWGWPGHVIDVVAVLATVFGLATSLGLGARQAGAGLEYLLDIPNELNSQLAIIAGVTCVAIYSVLRGIHGGVRVLSNINMCLAALLLVFVLVAGPTLAILAAMGTTAGAYVQNILPLSGFIGREDETWFHGWTVFYWAWWISWSPFVGMFIARVSRGRTVREFMTAVLLVPTLVTVVWLAAFGGTALEQIQAGVGELTEGLSDEALAMFQMLDNLPLGMITSMVAVALVLIFFITSADSGSLVVDSITAGGKLDAPVGQRVFWAAMIGLIAGSLLFVGGEAALSALQAGAITTGLPFTLVLLAMCFTLYRGLNQERRLLQG